jgi:hypothetical protein
MKSNYELINEVFKEMSGDNSQEVGKGLSIEHIGDCFSIFYKDEEVVKILEETLEDFGDPIKIIITSFYDHNKKARSKELEKELSREMARSFKKALKSSDDKEILSLIRECKEIKDEINELKEDLKWTKEVARSLYLSQEIFDEKIEDEVI